MMCAPPTGQELPHEGKAMANTISGGISFSGLGNGTDFSEIVTKLKQVESIQLNRMKTWKSDWNERYKAFGQIITSVTEAKSKLAALNSPQKFLTKVGTSSNDNVLSITAGADAVDGAHNIEVKQLASNAIWASNATYGSKTASVNTTGTAQDFSYTYKGKTRTLSIAANTTLESFANIVNQDASNPGVKISIISTADGYAFQIQGKESGAAADLTVHPSNLNNMGVGDTTWLSNTAIADPTAAFAAGGATVKSYDFALTMADGSVQNITLNGDMTQQDLANAINTATGTSTASFANGKLQLAGVKSVTTSPAGGTSTTTQGVASTQASFSGALSDTLDPAGDAAKTYAFQLTLADGTVKDISLDGSKTRQDLFDAIADAGVKISPSGDDVSGYTLTMSGAAGLTDPDGAGLTVQPPTWTWSTATTPTTTLQSGVVPKNLAYTLNKADGSTVTLNLTSDQSMTDLVDAINAQVGAGSAALVDKDGQKYLQLTNIFSLSGQGVSGQVQSSSNWSIRRSSDAILTVDNWPQQITSSSNTVSNVLDGMTLTLKDVGKAQVSVAADLTSVKENIQTVLDTINSVVKQVQTLTKWDSQKEVASSNSSDSNYSSSQWDQEKGSVLTGNYGVQLFNTRIKTLMSGTPPGFNNIQGGDLLSGDFVAALAQIGIKTCTTEGDPNYGLFMIAPSAANEELQKLDQQRFDDALSKNLDAVIDFFASDDAGSSSSSDFRYTQHIKGMTKPGTYAISYTVAADGSMGDVLINGVKASPSDINPGTYTVGDAGDASGLSITIDNLSPGTHTGSVSIKQGKIRQMEDFFSAELVYYTPNPSEPSISQNNGALMILQSNYKQIMDNIDSKIEREQTRLDAWERTQKLAFSRLETLLGQYERNQTSLTSQLTQLSSSSG